MPLTGEAKAARQREYRRRNPERQQGYRQTRYASHGDQERARAQRNTRSRWRERREWLNTLKMERGCIDCGFNSHPAALHFDHRDPSMKVMAISKMLSFSMEKILAEIEKCDVRCANCHAIRTATEQHYGVLVVV